MGEDRWRDEAEWPLARAVLTDFHLRADGGLTTEAAVSGEAPDSFTADPNDPVPTLGGNLCCWQLVHPPGAFDQREIEARDDVLVFSTEPLAEAIEVTGPLIAHVFVASTAADFDVTAKLVDVEPDGWARNVAEGIRRVRYRQGTGRSIPLPPGDVAEVEVDLLATANTFMAGPPHPGRDRGLELAPLRSQPADGWGDRRGDRAAAGPPDRLSRRGPSVADRPARRPTSQVAW